MAFGPWADMKYGSTPVLIGTGDSCSIDLRNGIPVTGDSQRAGK
ncbi:MAG: hypothetical protein WA634_12025 [Silvibacterium sp.]